MGELGSVPSWCWAVGELSRYLGTPGLLHFPCKSKDSSVLSCVELEREWIPLEGSLSALMMKQLFSGATWPSYRAAQRVWLVSASPIGKSRNYPSSRMLLSKSSESFSCKPPATVALLGMGSLLFRSPHLPAGVMTVPTSRVRITQATGGKYLKQCLVCNRHSIHVNEYYYCYSFIGVTTCVLFLL